MKQRVLSFDFFKCFACIAVCMIHCRVYTVSPIGNYISACSKWAVPFFFMISGYFYAGGGAARKLKHTLKLILLAVCYYFVFHYVCYCIIRNHSISEEISTYVSVISILKFILFNSPLCYSHLWYLFSLLYCYIFMYFSDKFIVNKKWKNIYAIFVLLFYSVNIEFFPVFKTRAMLDFCNSFFVRCLPFFFIGMCVKENIARIKSVNLWVLLPLFMTSVFENIQYGECQFYFSSYFIAVVLLLYCAKKPNLNNGFINFIGRELSTYVYIIHMSVLTFIIVLGGEMGYSNQLIWMVIFPFLVCLLSITGAYILYFVKRIGADACRIIQSKI